MCQPLDGYFFRLYKSYFRKFLDYILLRTKDMQLHNLNEVIMLHSLIYNQFLSPQYRKISQYSWYFCGYREEYELFTNPTEVLYHSERFIWLCSMFIPLTARHVSFISLCVNYYNVLCISITTITFSKRMRTRHY